MGAIVIGANSRIGANAVVVKTVPVNSVVVGVPGQVVHRSIPHDETLPDLNHSLMPDTIGASLVAVMSRLERIEKELNNHSAHPVVELETVLAHTHEHDGGNSNRNGKNHVPHIPEQGVWRGEDFQI